MDQWFTGIYERCEWGDNHDPSYRGSSGGGSDPQINLPYIKAVREFIQTKQIRSVVDLGCGDWQFSPEIYTKDLNVEYTGYDCYKDMILTNREKYGSDSIRFEALNVFEDREKIVNAELYILKDVLQHWTCAEIHTFLTWLSQREFRYVLVCNCSGQQYDYQDEPLRSRPLSIKYLPLKAFPFQKWFSYSTKEVSLWSKDDKK
jgi:hypothetical protein